MEEQISLYPHMALVIGSLISLIGLYKIVKNGIVIFLWTILLFAGISGVVYGLQTGNYDIPQWMKGTIDKIQVEELLEKIPRSALEDLCNRL